MRVYIEPKPKARIETEPVNHYEIEKDGGSSVDNSQYKTQKEAHESATSQGYILFYVQELGLLIKGILTIGGIVNKMD